MSNNDYIRALRAFDSHERGILLQWATGLDFQLSEALRGALGELLDLQVPQRAYVAMDYTLDWLHAGLRTYREQAEVGTLHDWPGDGRLTATGEDVDLLVAWQDQQPRLVLIEAKGFTGWSNKQLLSKALRLGAIFDEQTRRQVDVRFVLVGPKHSTGIVTNGWPSWMTTEERYHFLAIPDPGARLAVQRCTSDGKPTRTGYTHWRAATRKW